MYSQSDKITAMYGDTDDVLIIGGGLAGLCNAICLRQAGVNVHLIEQKTFPAHKVCGEYISNETLPFLQSIQVNIAELGPARISRLMLSSPSGSSVNLPLDLGGFGVSRYSLDHFLYMHALQHGVRFSLNERVDSIMFHDDQFTVRLASGKYEKSKIVIAGYGKRSNLDKFLQRPFINKRSPYVGVKYHIKTDFPRDLIALHNFEGGYCGISAIENEQYCLCYLSERNNLKEAGSIEALEDIILKKNPHLKHILENSECLFDKPLVINEISFERKNPVEDHILMCGDAAGMITPLCGNGMAMAIHSAKILSDLIIRYYKNPDFERDHLEHYYKKEWLRLFSGRISRGRRIQQLFGRKTISNLSIHSLRLLPPVASMIVKSTHGKPF